VDARTGFTHSFTTTAANEHDLNQAHELLLHGEDLVFATGVRRSAASYKVAMLSGILLKSRAK
jgi:IS5 family transposase